MSGPVGGISQAWALQNSTSMVAWLERFAPTPSRTFFFSLFTSSSSADLVISPQHSWSDQDTGFADLMDKILVLDPQKRLTASQALDHEWFWTDPMPTEPSK